MSEGNNDMTRRQWMRRIGAAVVAGTALSAITSCGHRSGESLSLKAGSGKDDINPFDADKIVGALPDAADCVGCGRCMPCPYGVDIPAMYTAYNEAVATLPRSGADFRDATGLERSREFVERIEREIGDRHLSHRCAACGYCMKHCPKKLPVVADMRRIGKFIDLTREMV